MLRSKLNQSFRETRQKRVLKTISLTIQGGHIAVPCSDDLYFGTKFIKKLGASSFIVLNIQLRRIHHLDYLTESSPNSW